VSRAGQTALALFVGGLLGIAALSYTTRREVAALKAAGDSARAAAVARDSAASAASDSMGAIIDSLQSSKAPVTVRITVDSAAQDSLKRALAAGLRSQHDTIANQAAQIVHLETEVRDLKANARTDSLSLWTALARSRLLEDSLHAQTREVVRLNGRIQDLDGHALPKWLRVSFDVAQKVLAAKGLVDLARGK